MRRDVLFAQPALPLLAVVVIVSLLAGCSLTAPGGGVSVWIDVPLDGLTFPDVRAVEIEGHAASSGGVDRVEIWIDGALLTTIDHPPMEGDLAAFHSGWTPSVPGAYTIQAVAFGSDGTASRQDSARVTIGHATPAPASGCPTPVGGGPSPAACPTLVLSATPVITDAPTSSPPPGAVVQFWAEPAEIQAGACTTIRWHVENVQRVIFGGVDQPFSGSYQACLCQDERYTLTVIHLDGSEEEQRVDIAVTGACVTPTPPPPLDATPPPAPTPAVPADGLSIACKASQNLAWLPVNDPSGIAEYRVQVQRHAGDNNWQDVSGSVFTGIQDKQKTVSVECGWYYRWRVRAVDGAGNVGPWSGWWDFAITLS
jgi:hypothetical protein